MIYFSFILLLTSCSIRTENAQVRKWEILALERQVDDLGKQNQELSLILHQMNSNHTSIRYFTSRLISDIERVKGGIIEYAINGTEPRSITSDRLVSARTRGTYYPRTFVFEDEKIPAKLTRFVVKVLSKFDKHPSTHGGTLNSFLSEMDNNNPNSIIENELFDGLNVGQTVQLLELVQLRILMEENKYLTNQFDHAINRMIVFSKGDSIN